MSNKTITIEIPNGKKAEWVNGVLTLVDEQPEKPKDVTERIKTFDDAYNELGEDHPLVKEYCWQNDDTSADLLAYLRLRIICIALNEGWQPQFTEDEERWYPWFRIYTKQELDDMNEDDRSRVVGRSGGDSVAYGGLVYADADIASSFSYSGYGSRLAFKSERLAEYAGRQFIDIWADFAFIAR